MGRVTASFNQYQEMFSVCDKRGAFSFVICTVVARREARGKHYQQWDQFPIATPSAEWEDAGGGSSQVGGGYLDIRIRV